MGQALKHMAVRLWASLLLGSLTALVVLPPLAGATGPGWMVVPAFLLVVAAYWIVGLVFAAIGHRRLDRLIGEATVWERAGMTREARQALTRAESTIDSYYFSPFSRKEPVSRLLAQLARFQLSQSLPDDASDAVIGAYLRYFPGDREAAIKWLETVLAGRPVTQRSHDIAAGIGAAHADDIAVQRMLAQFYLAEGCCDFAALKTYRQLVDSRKPLADGLLDDMIDLFVSQQRADNLALEVYLKGYQQGRTGPRVMEGIAACCRLVHSTPLTRPYLDKAESILSEISPSEREAMASIFLPEIVNGEPLPSRGEKRIATPSIAPFLRKVRLRLRQSIGEGTSAAVFIGHRTRDLLSARQTRKTVKWMVMGLFSVAVGWLIVSTALHLTEAFKTVEKAPEPEMMPISDPFTLQVAAYLKEDDAHRYVEQLRNQGLDAYWTRASGNNKTWYQVRISHFKTKAEARSMGENLKNRRLINDYYVANYKRPEGRQPVPIRNPD